SAGLVDRSSQGIARSGVGLGTLAISVPLTALLSAVDCHVGPAKCFTMSLPLSSTRSASGATNFHLMTLSTGSVVHWYFWTPLAWPTRKTCPEVGVIVDVSIGWAGLALATCVMDRVAATTASPTPTARHRR